MIDRKNVEHAIVAYNKHMENGAGHLANGKHNKAGKTYWRARGTARSVDADLCELMRAAEDILVGLPPTGNARLEGIKESIRQRRIKNAVRSV